MRMTKHQLFTIEGEILDSMETPASKETMRKLYVALRKPSGQFDSVSPKYFLQRLEYLIRMGHSSIDNIDKILIDKEKEISQILANSTILPL